MVLFLVFYCNYHLGSQGRTERKRETNITHRCRTTGNRGQSKTKTGSLVPSVQKGFLVLCPPCTPIFQAHVIVTEITKTSLIDMSSACWWFVVYMLQNVSEIMHYRKSVCQAPVLQTTIKQLPSTTTPF